MSTSISHRGTIRYIYYRCRSDSGGTSRCIGVNVGAYRLEQFVASALADVEDPGSDLPIELREQWVKLDERQRQKRLPKTIQRIVYIHSTGEATIEINPEAIAEFATNEVQSEDENPSIGISK